MGKGVSQSDKGVVAGSRTRRLYKVLVAQTCAVKETTTCLTAKLAARTLTTCQAPAWESMMLPAAAHYCQTGKVNY